MAPTKCCSRRAGCRPSSSIARDSWPPPLIGIAGPLIGLPHVFCTVLPTLIPMRRYPQPHAPHRLARIDGFTLLEVLITLAVAAILLGIAVPSYRSMVQRNSIAANVNDLIGDLNYARSEAVTRGQQAYVCNSANGSTCLTDGDWSQGWIVYVANDPGVTDPVGSNRRILRVYRGTGSGFSIQANQKDPVAFSSGGFALTSARSFHATGSDTGQMTTVKLSATGRTETEHTSADS